VHILIAKEKKVRPIINLSVPEEESFNDTVNILALQNGLCFPPSIFAEVFLQAGFLLSRTFQAPTN
jgi:hypothetical protein